MRLEPEDAEGQPGGLAAGNIYYATAVGLRTQA